jgi:NAD(P)H-dependent FMN reductase
MTDTRIAVLVGSLRADSVNRKLAEVLRDQAPAGVTLELVEGLGDLPFYNEEIDTEADIPAAAASLRAQVASADRVLAVTPEYNGTMPAVLNNAIDWLSRPYGQGALVRKPFGVVGTTPTPYGGRWAHADAARSAGIAGALVVEDVTVSQSSIDVDVLTDQAVLDRLRDAVTRLAEYQPESVAA